MNSIIFIINSDTKIVIEIEETLEFVHCCTEVLVTLFHNNKIFDLSTHSLRECLQDFQYIAKKLVKNELQLHQSIIENIGFLFNEELQYKPGLFQIKRGDSYTWIGYDYLLIMGYDTAVWLYNKNNGIIICEVSPKFPFSYRNFAKDKNYIPYKKWMKTYKPYFIVEASFESIKEWVSLADSILNQIQKNINIMR